MGRRMPNYNIELPKGDIVNEIAYFGERFEKEYLSKEYHAERKIDIERLQQDWWEALKFFLSRAFYQGRRDDISERVEKKASEVLSRYFGDSTKREEIFSSLNRSNWDPLRVSLKHVIGKNKVGRGRDIEMVIDTFRFVSELPHKNIVRYSVEMIENGKTGQLWNKLQKI
jgi:hypothetical protein